MTRFTLATAATLACCGMAFAQDKQPAPTPAVPATPAPALQPATPVLTPAPKHATSAADLKAGDAAPALSVEKWLKGDAVTGFEKGKVYVVEFWATWCGPCKASMPHLTELQKEYKSKGVTIIGMASTGWHDKLDKVQEMVKDKGDTMGYTIGWDKEGATNAAFMTASHQEGIPSSFVIDQKGKIAWIGHPMQLDFVLDDVLAGKWDYVQGPIKLQKMDEEMSKILEGADGDPKAALKAMGELEVKYPKIANQPQWIGMKYGAQIQSGSYADAAKTGAVLVDSFIASKNSEGLNEVAWQIVDPEGTVKKNNPALIDLALKAATKGVELTSEKNAAILDTLARCYWVKGEKTKAIDLQKKAIAAVTKDDPDSMKADLQKSLDEYQGGQN